MLCVLTAVNFWLHLEFQSVGCKRLFWKKCKTIFLIMSVLYLQREVLFHRIRHVSPPCFCSSPEQTKHRLWRGPFTFSADTVEEGAVRGV